MAALTLGNPDPPTPRRPGPPAAFTLLQLLGPYIAHESARQKDSGGLGNFTVDLKFFATLPKRRQDVKTSRQDKGGQAKARVKTIRQSPGKTSRQVVKAKCQDKSSRQNVKTNQDNASRHRDVKTRHHDAKSSRHGVKTGPQIKMLKRKDTMSRCQGALTARHDKMAGQDFKT